MQFQKIKIKTSNGEVQAIAPEVISASRATDIPAFHGEWLLNRLRAGYCIWQNPFNAAQKQHVSFKNARAIVFWSKNPAPFERFLPQIDAQGLAYYFQFTLNNFEPEKLEPCIPALDRRIEIFQRLSQRLGKHRVVWRMDPILLGGGIGIDDFLERAERLMGALSPHTEKMVFSFLDMYRKTEKNLKTINPGFRPPNEWERLKIASGLLKINNSLERPLELASCAENLPGIECNKCIDPLLLQRLCPGVYSQKRNKITGRAGHIFLSVTELPLMQEPGKMPAPAYPKDRGQRKECGCAPAKDIGAYNTCGHLCAYCYANHSASSVKRAMAALDATAEMLR